MAKHGLEYFVEQMGLGEHLPRFRREELTKRRRKQSLAVTYRLVFEELGPTFIKLGQILSTRPDMISKEYVDEFAKLQDQVNPLPFEQMEQVIYEELGKPIDEVFSEIDEEAISSASIGQVHRAVLTTGEVVALKVQKPNIRRPSRLISRSCATSLAACRASWHSARPTNRRRSSTSSPRRSDGSSTISSSQPTLASSTISLRVTTRYGYHTYIPP
jgi:hypothetical protein